MIERVCVVCGASFETGHNVKKTCSANCSKEWVRIKKRQNRKPAAKLEKTCEVCGSKFIPTTNNNQVICSGRCEKKRRALKAKIYRSKNPKYWREYYEKNKDKVEAQKTQYRKDNPKPKVRSSIKAQLGFEPPDDLVEEATLLRLINRAIKNAD
jgi:predicted nucleic acid-binding Zn ribbon protein